MILTEDEAKTKRCQESFAAGERMYADGPTLMNPIPEELRKYHPAGVTHTTSTYAPVNCLASGCMAWRWGESAMEMSPRDRFGISTATGKTIARGYCGKAGKP